jgi:hypothetical protein
VRWVEFADDLELPITCGEQLHTVRWRHGEVELVDHDDLDAELALVAFGGAEPRCLAVLALWNDATADGGFLGEWADGGFDSSRLWWLTMALERMRSEGFHEFLRDLPLRRANRMGHFLTTFPSLWIDRAATTVAERSIRGDGVECVQVPALITQAVARRLRRSFVLSVGGRQTALGAAALVPFEPVVSDGEAPAVDGVLNGRSSCVRVSVDRSWLFDVWGAGAAVIDGSLVLALDWRASDLQAVVVRWRPGEAGLLPLVRTIGVANIDGAWVERDQ